MSHFHTKSVHIFIIS